LDINRRLPGAKVTKNLEKAAKVFDINKEFLAGTVKITITGDEELSFEGNLLIVEYTDTVLRVAISGYIITVTGKNFEVEAVETDYLKLKGELESISYLK
jgi:sporulation protein YqfC